MGRRGEKGHLLRLLSRQILLSPRFILPVMVCAAVFVSQADVLTPGTPFFLVRTSRKIWLAGQMLYIILAVSLYLFFLLASTAVLCMGSAFTADMWSPTAALLGYSGEGESLFGLILLYTLVLV